jgi:dUTP pyrophosphatase
MSEIKVDIEICREGAKMPFYANPGDAGMDVYAAEEVIIAPGETKIVPTGLKVAIPEGYEIQVRPRSGISYKTPLRIPNSPGTIDSGYRDEIGIIMANSSCPCCSSNEVYDMDAKGNMKGIYIIRKNDRIAQIVIAPVYKMAFTVVSDVKEIGNDRGGGFGSTGV